MPSVPDAGRLAPRPDDAAFFACARLDPKRSRGSYGPMSLLETPPFTAPAGSPGDPSQPGRFGFCCKYIPPEADPDEARRMNTAFVTMATLTKLEGAAAFEKLYGIVEHNLAAVSRQIAHVAARPPAERLHRLISSILPGYKHPIVRAHYAEREMRALVETGFARIGAQARAAGVRLSTHPDSFCVLSNPSEAVLNNSLNELEYHAEMFEMMGLAGGWHPYGAHVNIHGGGRAAGLEGFRRGFSRLSRTAQGLVTVENDEIVYFLDELLQLAELLPIVLDLHHHWISTGGEYIAPDDPRVERVRDSWRGVRPVIHASAPKPELMPDVDPDQLPDLPTLVASGVKASELRAHSDMMWNRALNRFIAGHLSWADLEIEAKAKNLASVAFAEGMLLAAA